MTKAKLLRFGVLIVTAASLVHVSLLLPKFLTLVGQATGWGRVPAAAVFVASFAAVAGSLLAMVLLARSWARPEVRALAVFMAAAAASWGAILRLMSFGVDGSGISAYSSGGFLDAYVLMAGLLLVAASFLRFSALFPTALSEQAIPRHGRSRFLRRMRVRLLRAGLVWGLGVAGPMVVVGLLAVSVFIAQALQSGGSVTVEGWTAAPVTVVALLFPVAAMVFGVQNLTTGYRGADEGDRRKLLWLLVGVAVSTWMILLPVLTIPVAMLLPPSSAGIYGDLTVVLWGLAPGVLVSAVGVAVFYTGAVDPRLVLRRSTVLGVLGTVWLVVFAALESFMSQWLSTAFGVPDVVISVAAALLAAVLALPFRRVVAVLRTRVASARSHATATRA